MACYVEVRKCLKGIESREVFGEDGDHVVGYIEVHLKLDGQLGKWSRLRVLTLRWYLPVLAN